MFDEFNVFYRLEVQQDDTPVRGNVLCSGCENCDKRAEDEVIKRLNGGDIWAWATVRVVAEYDGIDDVYGDDYLGCCTYDDEYDFRANSGYYDDMIRRACDDLREKLEKIVSVVGEG